MESISEYIRRDSIGYFGQQVRNIESIIVLDDGENSLPSLQWIAEFKCRMPIHTTDPDYSSRLRVCWFTDDLPDALSKVLEEALRRADYETNAEDYDIMP